MFEMVDPLPGALRLKMPRFVIAWSIVDLVLCSLRALELPFLIAALILMERCGCATFLPEEGFWVSPIITQIGRENNISAEIYVYP